MNPSRRSLGGFPAAPRRRLQHVRRDDGAEDGERAHEDGHHAKAEAQRGGRLSARARVVGVGDDSVEAEPREGGDGLAEVVQQSEPALHADDARVALDVQRAKGESLAEAEPAEHDEGLPRAVSGELGAPSAADRAGRARRDASAAVKMPTEREAYPHAPRLRGVWLAVRRGGGEARASPGMPKSETRTPRTMLTSPAP